MDRYSSIRYKVHQTKEPLDKAFPELFRHDEFKKLKKRADFEKLIRYIMFLYDKNTQLVQEFQHDLAERKDEAAKDAGFERKDGKWGVKIQEVMDIKDEDVTAAIMRFLKIQKSHVWTEIIICEQELFDYRVLRFNPVGKGKGEGALDEKDVISSTVQKDKLKESCDIRRIALESLYEQFFGDNKDLQAAEFEESVKPETAERLLFEKPYEEIDVSAN